MTSYYRRQPIDARFIVNPHYANEADASNEAIGHQPYRSTPLILPGPKVKKEPVPNECYLRHHPNPAMRARVPHVDDMLYRQKVADSVLNRVVGDGKVSHKQFNSPIGLYSDNNIEHTIRSTVPQAQPYKKTVVFDPSRSETYRALQDEHYGSTVHEIPITVQGQTYQPNRGPIKKPVNYGPPQSNYYF